MKIAFVGPLKDMSGFAHASRNFLRMLAASDIDITARAITYDSGSSDDFSWMNKYLHNDLQNVDMMIQMTTCNIEANPAPGVCNGLYTFIESDRLSPAWTAKANQFDFILVPCVANAQAFARSGVTVPILVCPPPCDADVYNEKYEPYGIQNSDGRTIFYNICQLSAKKGIDLLLRAYYAAFADSPDDVLLVLKTYVSMHNQSQDKEIIKQFIEKVWNGCRIPVEKRPPVLPIIETVTDEEINQLHTAGDAYVCSSRAEGWCIPVFDAMCHGNTVITHNQAALADFVTPESALVYNSSIGLFYDQPHSDPTLFTGIECCVEPSVAEMAHLMKSFHLLKRGSEHNQLDDHNTEQWNKVLDKRKNAMLLVPRYDYRSVHSRVCPQLIHAFNQWQETGKVSFNENILTKQEVSI